MKTRCISKSNITVKRHLMLSIACVGRITLHRQRHASQPSSWEVYWIAEILLSCNNSKVCPAASLLRRLISYFVFSHTFVEYISLVRGPILTYSAETINHGPKCARNLARTDLRYTVAVKAQTPDDTILPRDHLALNDLQE